MLHLPFERGGRIIRPHPALSLILPPNIIPGRRRPRIPCSRRPNPSLQALHLTGDGSGHLISVGGSALWSPDGGGTGGPQAPTNFQMTAQAASSISLSWTASVAGTYPIASYNIYRNGSLLANTGSTGTTYTDSTATNALYTGFTAPATPYSYTITAVDTQSNESPQQTQMTAWCYTNGTSFFGCNQFGTTTMVCNDTAGGPIDGPYDISVTSTGSGNYTQPYSDTPFCPEWAMDINAFNYMIVSLKPTTAGQSWSTLIFSRVPPGDLVNGIFAAIGPGASFGGPAPTVGSWGSYKIPLASAYGSGATTFVGSISGTTLTVTSVAGSMELAPSGWVFGGGLASAIYIASGGPGTTGTYTLASSGGTIGAGTTFNYQRTNMYKVYFGDNVEASNVWYMDDWGFTVN